MLSDDHTKVSDAVATGKTIVVTRAGQPIAEIRPIHSGRRFLIFRSEIAALTVSGARVDRSQLRADLDQLIDPAR